MLYPGSGKLVNLLRRHSRLNPLSNFDQNALSQSTSRPHGIQIALIFQNDH